MGCCPSKKISPIIDSIRPITPGPSKHVQTNKNENINTKRRIRSAKVQPERLTEDCWLVPEYMRDAQKKINPVSRMGYINTYFDSRQEVQAQFKTMLRPTVKRGQLWLDKELIQELPLEKEDKLSPIEWKRPKVTIY